MPLSDQEKLFAKEYAKTPNKYQAAVNAGYSKSYARAQSYKMLDNVGMREEIKRIQDKERENVQRLFAIGASKAVEWMLEAIEDKKISPGIKQMIAKNFLDYAGFKPQDKIEHSGGIDIATQSAKVEKFLDDLKD